MFAAWYTRLVILCLLALTIAAPPMTTIRVGLPERDNLQYAAFLVANGAGFFKEEGIALELIVANTPGEVEDLVRDKKADAFVLSPPMYLRLFSERAPIVLVANLLANDGINLVVREDVAMPKTKTMRERVAALKGKKIGVAPGPRPRLLAVLLLAGLRLDDVQVVTVAGDSQNLLLGEKGIDALFCHTPYLERALVDQKAQLYINASAGDVPSLAGRQIHGLFVTRKFLDDDEDRVEAMVRAIGKALRLIRNEPKKAVDALLADLPSLDRKKVEVLIAIYKRAMPETPKVSVELIKKELPFFPAHNKVPDLKGVDLEDHVESDL
jgi:NitT/TauT family transport system substrate-binding protein